MGCGEEIKKDNNFDPINEIKNGNIINLYPNHNVSGDTIASKILFDSCVPTKILSHSVTSKFWAEGPIIDFLYERANIVKMIL